MNPTFIPDEVVTAAKMNSLPKGVLGYVERTTNQGPIAAGGVDLTGLTLTVNVTASRLLRVTAALGFTAVTANDHIGLRLMEGATVLTQWSEQWDASPTRPRTIAAVHFITPTAGSHTYKLNADVTITAGGPTLAANATRPAQFAIYDEGSVA